MRPQDIIADFLTRKGIVPQGRDTVDDIAIDLIEALQAEGLEIDYPYEDCC